MDFISHLPAHKQFFSTKNVEKACINVTLQEAKPSTLGSYSQAPRNLSVNHRVFLPTPFIFKAQYNFWKNLRTKNTIL